MKWFSDEKIADMITELLQKNKELVKQVESKFAKERELNNGDDNWGHYLWNERMEVNLEREGKKTALQIANSNLLEIGLNWKVTDVRDCKTEDYLEWLIGV